MRKIEQLRIGGGVASANADQEWAEKWVTSILLVGRVFDPPYERPPATNDYLRGESSKQDAYIDIPDVVEVMTKVSVMSLDTEAKVATLSNKEEIEYEHALLATGALIRRFPLEERKSVV